MIRRIPPIVYIGLALSAVIGGYWVGLRQQALPPNSPSTDPSSLTLLGDTFSGYSTFRSSVFQQALQESQVKLRYENEFDQAKRASRLNQGEVDLLVTTLDQFIKQQPQGKIIALIDRTVGADAVVLNTPRYPGLKSLLALTQLVTKAKSRGERPGIAFAGDTPSEYLALILDTKFDAFNLADFQIDRVGDASEAWKRIQDQNRPIPIAILWEPFVTQARQKGYTVVLSSQDAPGAIVDVLVASERSIKTSPESLSELVATYYRRIDANTRDASGLEIQIAADGQLTPAAAASVVRGIDFFTALEAQEWMNQGTLEKRIKSTAAVLTLAGKLNQVPTDVKGLYTAEFIRRAATQSQTLIELVRADNPELAQRLAGKTKAVVPTLSAKQIRSAPDIGNLQVRGEVKFELGSAQLVPASQQTLNKLVSEINEFNTETVAVRIIGHTSSTGDPDFNQTLSQQRAQAVVNYFKSKGLKHNLLAEGQGSRQLLAGIPATDPRNQRTEIRLVRVNTPQ